MPQHKQVPTQYEQTERLIEAVENLNFTIDCLKNYMSKDYSEIFMSIFIYCL